MRLEHLPISLWHRLLLAEFPGIYEAWRKDVTPYTWAFQNVTMLQNLRRELEEWGYERRGKARDPSHDPKLKARFLATEPEVPLWHTEPNIKKLKEKSLRIKKSLQPVALPHDKTNWCQLYSNIVRHWKDLKGLQNRERIWETIFDICGSIVEIGVDEAQDVEANEDDDVYEA